MKARTRSEVSRQSRHALSSVLAVPSRSRSISMAAESAPQETAPEVVAAPVQVVSSETAVAPATPAAPPATPENNVARPAQFSEVRDSAKGPFNLSIAPLMDVNLKVRVVLGETTMTLGDLLKLGEGSVIELSNSTGEPINIYVNDRLYAKGDIVVVEDMFGVRLSEVIDPTKKA